LSELAMTLMDMGITEGEAGRSTNHDDLIELWRKNHPAPTQ